MKRLALACVFPVVCLVLTMPGTAVAELERRPLARTPKGPAEVQRRPVRTQVEVHRDWPLKRSRHNVVVHPSRVKVRVRVEPRVFIPPIIFPMVPVPPPSSHRGGHEDHRHSEHEDYRSENRRDRLVWEDKETLYRHEEWTEFTLDCDSRGERLWFEVQGGRIRIDWAEVVFENGEVQVVDFAERSIGPGLYMLLDFRDGRHVDHVRMVAKSVTRDVKLILRMEK